MRTDCTVAENIVYLSLRSCVRCRVAEKVVEREGKETRGRLVAGEQQGDHVVDDAVVLAELAIMHDVLAAPCGVSLRSSAPRSQDQLRAAWR